MTVQKIAAALVCESMEECCKGIVPPWQEDLPDAPAIDAWKNVQVLKHQRAELVALFPDKKAQYDQDFNGLVMALARDVHSKLFEVES